MKKLRGLGLWLLLFAAGVLLGRQFSSPKTRAGAGDPEELAPVTRQGTARVAPLSEARNLLEGGGSAEALRDVDSSAIPSPDDATADDRE